MSQREVTDLVCRARRQELGVDEQRRLDQLLCVSFEARLMAAMLSESERDARVQAGDELLLARINARALGALAPGASPSVPRRRGHALAFVLAAAVLLMGSLAAAWIAHTARDGSEPSRPPPLPAMSHEGKGRAHSHPIATFSASSVAQPQPNSSVPPAGTQRPGSPALAPATARQSNSKQAQSPTKSRASELFALANGLRRAGQNDRAAELYRALIDGSPRSREAQPARLALAKLLSKQPSQALAQYRALAQNGGTLRAEGLWGVAETAASLGDRAAERAALTQLVRDYPGSPYAEIARQRLAHGGS